MNLDLLIEAQAHREGATVRRSYMAALTRRGSRPRAVRPIPGLSIMSFSGERDVPEQVACIQSFLANVGEPARWTIVSDGTHSPRSRALLRLLHSCVVLRDLEDAIRADLPPDVVSYAAQHPMGKKLGLELSLPVEGPTLYVDADVLFFGGADELGELVGGGDRRPRYLQDCEPYFDERLLDPSEAGRPVNGGVFLLWRPLEWRPALARLRALRGTPSFFTEQTLLHLAMHASAARPFATERFVVSCNDLHCLPDGFAGPDIALRHYTSPVRHKFWCAVERFGF